MSVITISRELGSEGSLIAEIVAKGLGYHLVDETTFETILKGYGLVQFDQDYRTLPGFFDRFLADKSLEMADFIKMLNDSLLALARHGDVVVLGRGGFAVLEGMKDVMNVRIQAPLHLRIERTRDSPAEAASGEAEQVVKKNDQVQEAFVKSAYGMPWNMADSYDLVINTGKIRPELAASIIEESVKALEVPGPGEDQTTAKIEVDHVLASAIQEALDCRQNHGSSNDSEAVAMGRNSARR
jgi:cytidylate kinase